MHSAKRNCSWSISFTLWRIFHQNMERKINLADSKPNFLFKAIALLFMLPIFPQLLYWKLVSGNWLFYSYGNEGFDFLHPHIFDGLFCFKNGWLSYTPIMLFGLIGIVLMHKKKKK